MLPDPRPANAQPNNSCLHADSVRELRAHGIAAAVGVVVETVKSPHGHISANVISDVTSVHTYDGGRHTLIADVYIQVQGHAQQQPMTYTIPAMPLVQEDDDGLMPNYLTLDGSGHLGQRARTVVHAFGHEYPSGWVTIGQGVPTCEP